jgi:RHS repeat-associated protein
MPNGEVTNQGYNEDGEFASLRFGNEENGLSVNRTVGSSKDFSTLWSGRTIDYTTEGANMRTVKDQDLVREYTYEPGEKLGRIKTVNTVTSSVYADEQTLAFQYDGMNIKAVDFIGDAQGHFTYTNNKFGLMTGMASTVTSSVYGQYSYQTPVSYNNDFEITQMGPFHYEYNGPNKRLNEIQDGGLRISRSYDELGRIAGLAYTIGDKELYNVSYTYDPRNFVDTKKIVSGGQTEQFVYTYDADDQLTDVIRNVNGSQILTEHYEYDDNKNRKAREVTGSDREVSIYGAYDVLQQVGSTPYEFDADGNLTRRGSDIFHYGPGGELLEAAANGDSIHYTYDGLGRLAAREDSQGKTQYLYGNMNQQKSVSASIGPDGVITVYNYDLNGYLISLERGGQTYYVITDQVATPVQVLDAGGETIKSMKYDSFGKLLEDSNPAFRLDIGFSGGIADEDTKLVRFSTRDYDPTSGRWMARDQVFYESGQANMYTYVNNNPIIVRDPCGQGCIGGSLYEGIGGGIKICIDTEGAAICGEVGVGIGGGIDISPFEELPSTHAAFEMGIKVKAGAAAIAGGYEWKKEQGSPCVQGAFKLSLGLGPIEYDAISPSESKSSGMPEDMGKKVGELIGEQFDEHTDNGWNMKNGLEAAAKVKGCKSRKW